MPSINELLTENTALYIRLDRQQQELFDARQALLAEGVRSREAEQEIERLRGEVAAARETGTSVVAGLKVAAQVLANGEQAR